MKRAMIRVRKVIQLRILSPLVGQNSELLLDETMVASLFLQRKMVRRAVIQVRKENQQMILSLLVRSIYYNFWMQFVIACFYRERW